MHSVIGDPPNGRIYVVAQKFNERSRRAARNTYKFYLPSNSVFRSHAPRARSPAWSRRSSSRCGCNYPPATRTPPTLPGLDLSENGPNTVTNVIVGTFSSSLSSFTGNHGPVASFLPVLDGAQRPEDRRRAT